MSYRRYVRRLRYIWLRCVRRLRRDRVFHKTEPFAQPGWYFDVRDGDPVGPFPDRAVARRMAREFGRACCQSGESRRESDVELETLATG